MQGCGRNVGIPVFLNPPDRKRTGISLGGRAFSGFHAAGFFLDPRVLSGFQDPWRGPAEKSLGVYLLGFPIQANQFFLTTSGSLDSVKNYSPAHNIPRHAYFALHSVSLGVWGYRHTQGCEESGFVLGIQKTTLENSFSWNPGKPACSQENRFSEFPPAVRAGNPGIQKKLVHQGETSFSCGLADSGKCGNAKGFFTSLHSPWKLAGELAGQLAGPPGTYPGAKRREFLSATRRSLVALNT